MYEYRHSFNAIVIYLVCTPTAHVFIQHKLIVITDISQFHRPLNSEYASYIKDINITFKCSFHKMAFSPEILDMLLNAL